jgi:hypothetical protein
LLGKSATRQRLEAGRSTERVQNDGGGVKQQIRICSSVFFIEEESPKSADKNDTDTVDLTTNVTLTCFVITNVCSPI